MRQVKRTPLGKIASALIAEVLRDTETKKIDTITNAVCIDLFELELQSGIALGDWRITVERLPHGRDI